MTEPISDQALSVLVELYQQATPGDWIHAGGNGMYAPHRVYALLPAMKPTGTDRKAKFLVAKLATAEQRRPEVTREREPANADFIMAIHNAFPAIIARLTGTDMGVQSQSVDMNAEPELIAPTVTTPCLSLVYSDIYGTRATTIIDRPRAIDMLSDALASISHGRIELFVLRYGLDGGPFRTFREVATITGYSSTTISQTVHRILRALRHPVRSRPLRDVVSFD